MDEEAVRARLLEMLSELEPGVQGSLDEPIATWLDSMGRLELVELVESEWGADLEHMLLGEGARSATVVSVVNAVIFGSRDVPPPM